MPIRVGSLFSGIGGFDLGLEWAGMEIIWQSEINPYATAVLKKHWPDVPNLGNIKGIRSAPPVDLICGGFPCQPASIAGKRMGKTDDRWLWPEMFRVISIVRPRWVLAENVCGLLSLEQGLVLENCFLDLETIGYEIWPVIIPACAVNAPHRRNRVWIIADMFNVGFDQGGTSNSREKIGKTFLGHANQDVADSESERFPKSFTGLYPDKRKIESQNCTVADYPRNGGRRPRMRIESENKDWAEPWTEVATRLCRVDDGVPRRVDRIRCLGNAVVPQIAEILGKMILMIGG